RRPDRPLRGRRRRALHVLRDAGPGRGRDAPQRRPPLSARPSRRPDLDLLSRGARVHGVQAAVRRAKPPQHRVRRARRNHAPALLRHGRRAPGPRRRRARRGARVTWAIPLTDVVMTEDDLEAVADCLRSGWLTMGPRTQAFEAAVAEWTGAEH